MNALMQLAAVVMLLAVSVGCEAPALPTGPAAPPAATTVEAPPAAEEKPIVAGVPGEELPEIETPVTNTPRPFNSHDPIKGRRSRRAGGYLGATAGAKFHAEYQMLINNINHANQLYWGEHLEYPKSNEEFMEKIIEFNKLVLPELEPEHEYIYVPEQPEVGLQIRLKQSESTEEGQPAGEAEDVATPAESPAADETPTETTEAEPPIDLRERAAGLGGLAPAGGLEE